MKKKLYSTIIGLLAFASVNAQITITAPPVSIASQIDTFAVPDNKADFKPLATHANNAHWDFTIAQYPNIQYYTLRTTTPSTNYPTAKFNHSFNISFAGGLGYDAIQYYDVTSSSIVCLGEAIETEQVIPLTFVTGGANDELVFPVQKIAYSAPDIQRVFPTTLGTSFTSTRWQETKFNLTIDAYALNNVPGTRKTYWVVKDSVVGWGTIKVKGISTKATYDNIPVLQVQHFEQQTDSFFLGGNPAPEALLTGFGLAQGKVDPYYYVNFIAQDELDELVTIDFGQSPYQTIEKVKIQQNRLEKYELVGIEKLAKQNAINTYPNPIKNNTLFVDLPANPSGQWSFNLVDIYGRNISKGDINTIDGRIDLPANTADGSYVLTIMNDGITVSINKIFKQQ